jgi:ornithine--oxo-acid transaminase
MEDLAMKQTAELTGSARFIELEERHGAHNYHPLDVVIAKAEGAWVWDVEGKRYMDFLAAYSAVNQGHCHPRLVKVMREQAERVTLTSRAFRNDQLGPFCEELTSLTGFHRVLPMNTGAEAVETAIKAARKWGYTVKGIPADEAEILVFAGNFHGRTTTIVGFSSDEEYRFGFGPFTPGFRLLPGRVPAPAARDHHETQRAADDGRDPVGARPHRQALCVRARGHPPGHRDHR